MYQALYRKWRPCRFDEVVGQEHITHTLQHQVATGRLSHAYLFTGTRGTGKTSCAKIFAKAINCEMPENGNPCNQCSSCLGIDSGSILDVLELDAASNNGVDQVRALRDEAIYTPAAVKMRVYIIDEVHMLSTPAFNALLKILEEPPAHLLFILATTELHKVPATIKSRCQQFSFKRILPEEIVARLHYVAGKEGFALSDTAARLLARLAEGGLRDALSLLDQCVGGRQTLDEGDILQVLGLAGNEEIARLLEQVMVEDASGALAQIARLYREGKDMSALLGELSALLRDLLLRKTAPRGGLSLLTGGYEESQLRKFSEKLSSEMLFQMLALVQGVASELYRSSNRRTDVELCVMKLCTPALSTSMDGILARISRLEQQLSQGGIVAMAPKNQSVAPQVETRQEQEITPISMPMQNAVDPPPWEDTSAPPIIDATVNSLPKPVMANPAPVMIQEHKPPQVIPVQATATDDGQEFQRFATSLRGKLLPSAYAFLIKPTFVTGIFQEQALMLYVDSEMTKSILGKPDVQETLKREATAYIGRSLQIQLRVGKPDPIVPQESKKESKPEEDKLQRLIKLGGQFDNITIQ